MQGKQSVNVKSTQRKLSGLLKEFAGDEIIAAGLSDNAGDENLALFTDPHILNSFADDINKFLDAFNVAINVLAKGRRKRSVQELAANFVEKVQSSFHFSKDVASKDPSFSKATDFNNKKKGDLREVVTKLSKYPSAEPFLYPVDKSLYPEYYETIEKPMDLTTFKKSITDYSTLEDALFALRLIWRNCLEYNVEGSDIASAAIELGHEAEQLIEEKFGISFCDESWNLHRKTKSAVKHHKVVEKIPENDSDPHTNMKSEKKRSKRAAPSISLTNASMKDIIKAIQSSEYAEPFLNPVTEDIAPGYFDVISTPMDISTIKKKLRTGMYDDRSEEFIQDFHLIWDNCALYNEPSADIVSMANSLSQVFEELLSQYSIVEEPTPAKKKVAKELKTSEKPEKAGKADKVETPRSKETRREKVEIEYLDIKECGELVHKLKSHPKIEPFLVPVDPKFAPGYSEIIEKPMDIAQVEKKLKKGVYDSDLQLFVADVRLIWQNCKEYNDSDSDIFHWANECDEYFEKELQHLITTKKDQIQMEALRNSVGSGIIGKKSSNHADSKTEPKTEEKKDRAPKRPQSEEGDVSRKKLSDIKPDIEKKPSPAKPQEVSSVLTQQPSAESKFDGSAAGNVPSWQDLVGKRVRELQSCIASLKVGDSLNLTSSIVRDQCHKKAAERYKDFKNGFILCPNVLQVLKFGEIDQSLPSCDQISIFPLNYTSLRSLRIRLLPNNCTSQDGVATIPFVPINLKSIVALSEDKGSVVFRIVMDNGVVVSEAPHPLIAWQNILGREINTFHSMGSKLRRCRAVFNRVCASPDSVPFLEKSSLDEADGYYKVIQAPMWLREIHTRLIDGVYDNEYDFAWDMRLIARNCKTYNLPKSSLYASADRLSALFETLFLFWVVNVQDRSIDDIAKGDWDDWNYLRYFDGDENQNFCTMTKTKAKANELLQCAWCEDQYLPASLKLPNSKLGMKTWGCPRCRRAMELSEGDMAVNPYANLVGDLPYSAADIGGNVFVAAPELGVGWNQARRKNRNSGLKNVFLSPLGYEVFSMEDVQLQKDFEAGIDLELVNARAKEFKELQSDKKSPADKRSHRGKGRKARGRKANQETDEEVANDIQAATPIDAKFLEEEGRIVTGKLVDFVVPSGYHLAWCINSDEQALFESHQAEQDIQSMLNWNHEIQVDDLTPCGYFAFNHPDVRCRIEALPNANLCQKYHFLQAETIANELLADYTRTLNDYQHIFDRQDQFQKLILEERWKYEKSKLFPAKELVTSGNDEGGSDEEFSLKCSQLGFKMVVSKMFPTGGLDTLLSLWDLLDSIKPIIGFNYFTLVDLISSVNPPATMLTTPSQVIFDEVCCILTEQLLLECRNRAGIVSEYEWQNLLMVHPLNIITWPKILEKCILVIGLPLSAQDAKQVMESSIQGEYAVFLKVLCVIFNHPHIECVFDHVNEDGQSLGGLVRLVIDNLLGVATTKLENSQFCSTLLSLCEVDNEFTELKNEKCKDLSLWIKALFRRIGFKLDNVEEEAVSSQKVILNNNRRSWGTFVLSGLLEENSQILLPHHFSREHGVDSFKKMKSLSALERGLSLLSATDSEGLCSQDRLSIYVMLIDNVLVCRNVLELFEKREKKLLERFKTVPSTDSKHSQVLDHSFVSVSSVPKSAKCYFSGIPFELVNDPSAWVTVPTALLIAIDHNFKAETAHSEISSNDLHMTRRPKRGEVSSTDDGQYYALKSSILQLLASQTAAKVEKEAYEAKMEAISQFFGSQFASDFDLSYSIFSRSHPIGFDRHGNSFWLLSAQQSTCLFEHDARGKCMDPLDPNTREPCVLLRDVSGQWYYNTGSELNRLVQSFSLDIPCERQLKYRLIEKYLLVRAYLFSSTLNVKSGQQVWIDRKHAMERWIVETPLFSGTNDSHRCRQLEVTLARCCETRMNVYCSSYFRDEEETDRSQRAEREAVLRKQKKIRDAMVEESFDLHPIKGWFHRDNSVRLRQLAACCNATKIQGDQTIAGVVTTNMSRSQFLAKFPEVEVPAETNKVVVDVAPKDPSNEEITEEKEELQSESQVLESPGDVHDTPMEIEQVFDETKLSLPESSTSLNTIQFPDEKLFSAEPEQIHKRSTAVKAIEQLHVISGEILRIYPSGREAAAFMNISQSGISLCTNGLKSEANGFRWRSYDGPPIDFDAIAHIQTSLDDLKSLQVIRGNFDEEKMQQVAGKTALFQQAIATAASGKDGLVAFHSQSAAFRTPVARPIKVPVPQQAPIFIPQAATIAAAIQVPEKSAPQVSTVRPSDAQNYTFPSPPAFPKPQTHIVTSTKTAAAKLIKLKGELFNILFAFPEKALKWPELDAAKENMVKEAGEAAIKGIYDANKDSGIAEADLEKMADKASRKARRRLRRKLAVDQFSVAVQQAVTPQELLNQVIILEYAVPKFLQFSHDKRSLPLFAYTAADVALRLFVLDRIIAYHEIIGLENASLFSPYKLRSQFSPRCCASAICTRILGHPGKCTQGPQVMSRLPDHFQLAPSNDPFSRNPVTIAAPTHPTAAHTVPVPNRLPNQTAIVSRHVPPPRPYDELLPSLASIADKPTVDIEFVNPFFPNNVDLLDSQWV